VPEAGGERGKERSPGFARAMAARGIDVADGTDADVAGAPACGQATAAESHQPPPPHT